VHVVDASIPEESLVIVVRHGRNVDASSILEQ